MAIQRVAERVAHGGHNIPMPDIRRRYARGLKNLHDIYLPIVGDAWVLNGAMAPPEIIWRRLRDRQRTFDADLWNVMKPTVRGDL